jgi:methionyl-tRNA formyltransferase
MTDRLATPVRIALAGSVGSSRRTLQALLRHKAHLVGVLELDAAAAAGVSGYAPLADLAASAGVPCVGFRRINDPRVIHAVRNWRPDLVFVAGLSQLVGEELLRIPTRGCVGFHPTRLPHGRGRAPLAWLTLDGRGGAATFFLMDAGADSGPILIQEPFEISPGDDAAAVGESLLQAMDRALDHWLPALIAGEWSPQSQDHAQATWFGRRGPEDGHIHWNRSAEDVVRLVRASTQPHPGAYVYVGGRRLRIWQARVDLSSPHRGVPGRILEGDDASGWLVQAAQGLVRIQRWSFDEPQIGHPPRLRVGLKLADSPDDEIFDLRQRVAELEARLTQVLQTAQFVPTAPTDTLPGPLIREKRRCA